MTLPESTPRNETDDPFEPDSQACATLHIDDEVLRRPPETAHGKWGRLKDGQGLKRLWRKTHAGFYAGGSYGHGDRSGTTLTEYSLPITF